MLFLIEDRGLNPFSPRLPRFRLPRFPRIYRPVSRFYGFSHSRKTICGSRVSQLGNARWPLANVISNKSGPHFCHSPLSTSHGESL